MQIVLLVKLSTGKRKMKGLWDPVNHSNAASQNIQHAHDHHLLTQARHAQHPNTKHSKQRKHLFHEAIYTHTQTHTLTTQTHTRRDSKCSVWLKVSEQQALREGGSN